MHEHSPRSGRFNVWLAGLAFGLALQGNRLNAIMLPDG